MFVIKALQINKMRLFFHHNCKEVHPTKRTVMSTTFVICDKALITVIQMAEVLMAHYGDTQFLHNRGQMLRLTEQ